jgi:hypothetical protein
MRTVNVLIRLALIVAIVGFALLGIWRLIGGAT